jgi:DNA topoisomerase IA
LPALAAGDELEVVSTEITTHKTKPKPLFTQASLVAELKRLGIGRPSTYQSVVPLLLTRSWATEEAPAANGKSRKKSVRLPVLVPDRIFLDSDRFGRVPRRILRRTRS